MLLLIFLNIFFLNPDTLIKEGLNYAYNLDFKKAESCFYYLNKLAPNSTAGYFFQTLLLQVIMVDSFNDRYKNIYYEKIKKTINLAKKNSSDFYLGSAYLYWALFEGWRKNYWQSYLLGMEIPKYLNRALEKDRNLFDCYLGLGLYEYFKSKANKYIFSLKLFGNKEKALGFLKLARDSSKILKVTAQYAYAWVLIQEKRFTEAETILKKLLERYPNNKIFLRLLRDMYYKKGDYQQCLAIGEKLKILEKRRILENELIMGKTYYFLKDYKKAKEHFSFIINNKEKFKNQVRFKDHYKEALKYFQKVRWY
ncbi:MAG: tetratricopeptide repeat protein [candidate division WOR-3 bacterium]